MVLGNVVFGSIALGLWVAVVWRAVHVGPGGPLWWVSICVAVIVTLKTGVVADPFNLATGGVYLDVVIQHVLGVVAATLVLLWLAGENRDHADPPVRTAWAVAALVIVALVATWFLGPVYDIPADSDWVPEPVIRSPAVATHFVVMDVFQAVFSAVFARTAVTVARSRPAGPTRRSVQLLATAAAGLGLSAVIGLVGRGVAIAAGATPPLLYAVQNAVLAVVFALFVFAVVLPGSALGRRTRRTAPA